jgi:periplasmic protein TonB
MIATSRLPPQTASDRFSMMALSAVPELQGGPSTTSPGLRRLAVLAAALLHLAVFLWLFHPWLSASEQLPPADIPITLVFEPPAEPKAPPAPAQQPAPSAPQGGWDRSSGPDAKTTAPPTVETDEAKNEDAPGEPPSAPAPPDEVPAPPPPPAPAIIAEPPIPVKPRTEPPRPAARPRDEKPVPRPQTNTAMAMHPRPPPRHAEPGERRTTGDPYLNAVLAEFEKHRFYPPLGRPLGLTGVAAFGMRIDRTGRILTLWLEKTSGAEILDRAAEKMIRDTERIPPPPPEFPGSTISLWIEIPMAPH